MAEVTGIEWTGATWNPVTGCTLVSEGCRNCYAAELAAGRLRNHSSRAGLAKRNAAGVAQFTGEVRFNEQWLDQPLTWRKPRMIFVCAHGDLFHESVPDEWIDQVFAVMEHLAPHHTYQVLTKRPDRMRAYLRALVGRTVRVNSALTATFNRPAPQRHIWLGTSVENQATADERIPALLDTPAAVRFISAEPLLELVSLGWAMPWPCTEPWGRYRRGLDWVIVGGESGKRARDMDPAWARSLRDQCASASVAFFMKQMARKAPIPADLMIRQFPVSREAARMAG